MTAPANRQFSMLTVLSVPAIAGLFLAGWRFCETHPVESWSSAMIASAILATMAALAEGGWRIVPAMAASYTASAAAFYLSLLFEGWADLDLELAHYVALQCMPVAAFTGALAALVRAHGGDKRSRAIAWTILCIASILCGSYGHHLAVHLHGPLRPGSLTRSQESAKVLPRRPAWG